MMLIGHETAGGATPRSSLSRVIERIAALGLKAHAIPGVPSGVAIGITGNQGSSSRALFGEFLPGVLEVIPVSHPYKLVSREAKSENSVVDGTWCSRSGRRKLRPLFAGRRNTTYRHDAVFPTWLRGSRACTDAIPDDLEYAGQFFEKGRLDEPWLPVIPIATRWAPGMAWPSPKRRDPLNDLLKLLRGGPAVMTISIIAPSRQGLY